MCAGEKSYSATEREFLVVVWAVQMLRLYIERLHFTLYTDHQALKCLFDLLDTSSALHLTRLRLLLQELDNFAVRYRRGPDYQVAYAISRLQTYDFDWHKTDD